LYLAPSLPVKGEEGGEEGLQPAPRGRTTWTVTGPLTATLRQLLDKKLKEFGYLRSRWCWTENHGMQVHPSTLRRLLPRLGYVWRRARPRLNRRNPQKNQKLQAIEER